MKIVAYCRVSTDREEQLESLANQQKFFEGFAEKNGHELVKIYSDEGISGKQMKKRGQFLRMLEDSKLGLFEMVVVKDISRFARNTVDFLTAIRELKSRSIEVQFLSTNQTILGNSEFILTIFSALAQEESANLSSRVKFGKKQSAKNGKVPNFVYGYDRIDRYNLKINEEQANIIKQIYKWYTHEHIGVRAIATRLTRLGVSNTKGGDFWIEKTIRRILSNPIYKGMLISRKSESIDFLTGERKALPAEDEFIFQREDFRIIDNETYDMAQKILAERAAFYKNKNPKGRVSSKYPFSSLIRCEHCGYAFTRRLSNSNPPYALWKCNGRNAHNSEFCGNKTRVIEDDLVEFLKNYFTQIIEDPSILEKDIDETMDKTEPQEDIESLQKQIKKLEHTKKKYMDMYINEIITIDELKKNTSKISNKITELTEQILNTQNKDNENEQGGIAKIPIEDRIREFLKNGEYTHIELKKIIKQILVNDRGQIKIEFL